MAQILNISSTIWLVICNEVLPILSVLLGICMVLYLFRKSKGRQISIRHEVGRTIFMLYLYAILNSTLFNVGSPSLDFVGNSILFIPLGFLIPMLWPRLHAWWKVVSIGVTVSLSLALIQHFTQGSAYIAELLLCILGASIGYILFWGFQKVIPSIGYRFASPEYQVFNPTTQPGALLYSK